MKISNLLTPMISKSQFAVELRKYLQTHVSCLGLKDIDLFEATQTLGASEKRGIWKQVGNSLGFNDSEARNYYHNTWSVQFYASLSEYRGEIKEMVKQQLLKRDFDTKEVL